MLLSLSDMGSVCQRFGVESHGQWFDSILWLKWRDSAVTAAALVYCDINGSVLFWYGNNMCKYVAQQTLFNSAVLMQEIGDAKLRPIAQQR